ncbi:MAG: NADH-quinone oxidoreductase subunit L [Alphaproteobacteria bacterium]|nr:NADH-quinone oxidoreductase subunit L [Alphaproteobacteria bacterium]OJV45545.1 MAG: NADH-quinone oxidoreductase subunit L [Alphaproteobacteria bacterium 43-37]
MIYLASIFLPLISFIILGLFGSKLKDQGAAWISASLVILSAICGSMVFYKVAVLGKAEVFHLMDWVSSPTFSASWNLKFDTLSAIMVLVVTSVSSMVHVYSIGYMHHDPSVPRFLAYLGLFTFFMLMLVTASNLLQLFFGWEGVGLASYLLIGFWYEKESANAAAMKAFVVNRIGDVSFALGLLLIYVVTGSLDFDVIFSKIDLISHTQWSFLGIHIQAATAIVLLLLVGASGKSAQLGLHVWLPDAMEGPTPVSALIHAATMVTAGVFMLVRMSPVVELSEVGLMVIACLGALTAFFAGTVAITQNDIKRVIAYSTCSQLGFMFFAVGVSAYHAAMFHLFTHAFFKALLFLGAGSVIHALCDEQDMRKMGGVWRSIPMTYAMMWVGTLALTGFPLMAGYYSKDLILESVFASSLPVSKMVFVVGIMATAMTALYSWRLMFLTFHGKARADEQVMARVHESPPVMIIPLFVLAIGSVFAGMFAHGLFSSQEAFWRGCITILPNHDVAEIIHHLPIWVTKMPLLAGITGFLLAWFMYIKQTQLPLKLATSYPSLYNFLFHKWYFDELYHQMMVKPVWCLGFMFWKKGDQGVIDPFLPDGMAKTVDRFALKLSRFQSGYVYQYAIVFLLGVILLTVWQLYSGVWTKV